MSVLICFLGVRSRAERLKQGHLSVSRPLGEICVCNENNKDSDNSDSERPARFQPRGLKRKNAINKQLRTLFGQMYRESSWNCLAQHVDRFETFQAFGVVCRCSRKKREKLLPNHQWPVVMAMEGPSHWGQTYSNVY